MKQDWLTEPAFLSRRQFERKTNQFCRQVQRALNLALADPGVCPELEGLYVEEVLPAPHCGRLLVRVLTPDELPVEDAMAALGEMAPRLRAEVAAAITRKRAPQLSFVPVDMEGGGDE
ncbi:MAG: ribosome-binding factor A [Acidobacteria bacterium]|nr:ribosome-binding factor A [Acidobacteriota bacterium]